MGQTTQNRLFVKADLRYAPEVIILGAKGSLLFSLARPLQPLIE